jgi:hypothetical protein
MQSDGLSSGKTGVGRVTRSQTAAQARGIGKDESSEEAESMPHRRKRQSLGDGRSYAPMLGTNTFVFALCLGAF